MDSLQRLWPGFAVSAVVALAALFLARHYGAPVMLLALLLGMALNFLSQSPRCTPGIDWTSRQVLRLGVALLGLRVTWSQVTTLSWTSLAFIVVAVGLTIACGIIVARLMGFRMFFGLLTGGAVAICGASAALALAAAMPSHPLKERATLFTVIGVSTLSTLAMVSYPLLANGLGLDHQAAGFFIGATIHDVAQVVGAGYSISHEAGDTATVVKLLRVALLLPVILLASFLARAYQMREAQMAADSGSASRLSAGPRPPLLPWFAVGFALLVGLNSTGWLAQSVVSAGVDLSQACLVAAMAAIGLKTHLREMVSVGWKAIALMVIETLFLAGLCLMFLEADRLWR
jgi:uncharacterized integral membrane protein (TIGR00698 family)